MPFKKVLLFTILTSLILHTNPASYNYSACTEKSYLNTANLQCVSCLTNQTANTYQSVATACQCAVGYFPSGNGGCSPLSTSLTCGSTNNTFYPVYNLTGAIVSFTSCEACTNAYTNSNGTGCQPCGRGMKYTSQGCVCNDTYTSTSYIATDLGCFSVSGSLSYTTSKYANQLKYLIPGCATYADYLSCSYLSNLCAFSQGIMTTPQCLFFTTYSLTTSLYANSSSFSLTFTKQNPISMKIVSFLPTGNYIGEKTFVLNDLMKCGTPTDAGYSLQTGTNIRVTCQYNVNSLIAMMGGKQWKGRVYQLLVLGDDGSYYDIGVTNPGSSQAIKRFFTEDTFTSSSQITLMTGFTLSFTFSNGKLINPTLSPSYSVVAIQSATGTAANPLISMDYEFLFTTDISSFWTGALAAFIAISVVAIIHSAIKTYIGYLNRRSGLQFFINFAGLYSLWLYYFLLFMTGYWFLFTKTASTPIIILPSHSTALYGSFYALVGVMVGLRLLWVVVDKAEKLSTQVFVINWQRNEFKNSWREIFVVNSLAEFYTHRTVSIFWMLAVVLFFMTGVGWERKADESATSGSSLKSLTPVNRLLLYFLSCAVFLAVGIIFKILRRISVLFWPYPFEDFADYCTIANISLFFVKRRAPQAYYLHAYIPDRSQVSYKEINEAIRRGLQKNRTLANELPADSLSMYSIYLSREMEEKHTQLLRVLEEQEHSRGIKFGKDSAKKIPKNPREDFVENRLKPHLEGIANGENNNRRKSVLQNLFGTPPVDLREGRQRGKSEVFFDDQLELVNQVFPNGNEFEDIHTIMVLFLGWVTLVNSCPIAAFLTYFVDQYLLRWWIEYSCRSHLEEMTRVKRGFML